MKYKTLKFGRCYVNEDGSFVVCLLAGSKRKGYLFAASHVHPFAFLGTISLQSRIVENDGRWIEINPEMFNVASAFHATGHVVKLPSEKGSLPRISKKY
jgi:hypothetical protein